MRNTEERKEQEETRTMLEMIGLHDVDAVNDDLAIRS